MFIKTTALGRLTKDPVVKTATIGGEEVTITEFTLACDNGFGKNKKTEFIDITAWRKQGETIAQHCTKGSVLFVEATPATDKYETEKEGVTFKVSRTRYTLVDFRFGGNGSGSNGGSADDGDAPF